MRFEPIDLCILPVSLTTSIVLVSYILFCFDDCLFYIISPFVLKDLGISNISKTLTEIASPAKKSTVNLQFFYLVLLCKEPTFGLT